MNAGAIVDPSHRQLGMESDLANPNFAGARNPDDLLWVKFYMKAVHDVFKSEAAGRPIYFDQPWVEITVPGNGLLTIDEPATDIHKRRFPRHWALFQQTHGEAGQNVGTPLSQWPLLKASQVEMLRALKFFTVEQIAMAGDQQISSIGMAAGMAPTSLRDRAKLYLESASNTALAVKQEAEIKKRDEEIAALNARLARLEGAQALPAKETLHVPKGKAA